LNRDQLEHVIFAAAELTGDNEIVVIGSQAMLGSYPDAPEELQESMEADFYPRNRPQDAEKASIIGELTSFHDLNGYYAHAVSPETFTAPAGWESRLVRVEASRAGSKRTAVGWCLEPHDLVASKCAARRERDFRYARVCIDKGLVDRELLWRRALTLPLADVDFQYVLSALAAMLGRSGP
jgi:hypothetical protein